MAAAFHRHEELRARGDTRAAPSSPRRLERRQASVHKAAAAGNPILCVLYSDTVYFLGSTACCGAPCGWGCIPGGVSPCGLDAGAPPVVVVVGPVLALRLSLIGRVSGCDRNGGRIGTSSGAVWDGSGRILRERSPSREGHDQQGRRYNAHIRFLGCSLPSDNWWRGARVSSCESGRANKEPRL